MSSMKSIEMSKNLVLSFVAVFLWIALGGGILQFLMGNVFLGGIFVLVGLVLLLSLIDGRLPRYLIGREILKTNVYLMVFVLILVAGNEIYGLVSSRSITETIRFAQISYIIGFCLLSCVMVWQVLRSTQSEE